MHIAARRLGLDPGRARAPQPRARRADALPRGGGRGLRLRRLPRAASSGARPGRLRRPARRAGARARRRPPARRRARLRRRAERLQHGLHHARPDRRGARARPAQERQRRGRDDRDRTARRRDAAHHDHAAGPGPPHRRGAGRGRRARTRARADRRPHRRRHRREPVDGLLRQLLQPLRRDGRLAPCTSPPSRSPIACGRSPRPSSAAPADAIELAEGRARVRGDEARTVSCAAWPAPRTGTRPGSPGEAGRDSR